MANNVTTPWLNRVPNDANVTDLTAILADFEASQAGRTVARFASRATRNTATTAFLAAYPGQTGMQAYTDDLYTNTVYTPNGWRYVSQIATEDMTAHGYGTGAVVENNSTWVDTSPILLFGVPPDALIRLTSRLKLKVDGNNDQTWAVTYDTIGATRNTPDPLIVPERIIGSTSPDKYGNREDLTQQYTATNTNVQFNMRVHAGNGGDRLVAAYAVIEFRVLYGRNPAS